MTKRCVTTSMYLPDGEGRPVKVALDTVWLWSRDPLSGQAVRVTSWKGLAELERRGEKAGGFDGRVLVIERGPKTSSGPKTSGRNRIAAMLAGRKGDSDGTGDTDDLFGARVVHTDSRRVRKTTSSPCDVVSNQLDVGLVSRLPREMSLLARSPGAMLCSHGRLGSVAQRVVLRDPRLCSSLFYNEGIDPVIWRRLVADLDDERYRWVAPMLSKAKFRAGVGTLERLGSDDALRMLERWGRRRVRDHGSPFDDGVAEFCRSLPEGALAGQDGRVLEWELPGLASAAFLYREDLGLEARFVLARRVTPMARYRWLGQCDPSELNDRQRYPSETLADLMVLDYVSPDAPLGQRSLSRELRAWAADVFSARADVALDVASRSDLPVELLPVLARVGFQPGVTDQLLDQLSDPDVSVGRTGAEDYAHQARRLVTDRVMLRRDQRERLVSQYGTASRRTGAAGVPDEAQLGGMALETLNDAQIESLTEALLHRAADRQAKTVRDGRNDDLLSVALAVGERLQAANPRLASRLGRACLGVRVGQAERPRPVAAAKACGVMPGPPRPSAKARKPGSGRVELAGVLYAPLMDISSGAAWVAVSEYLEAAFSDDSVCWQLAFGMLDGFTGSACDLVEVVAGVVAAPDAGH